MKVEPPADNDRPTAPTTLTKSALLLQWVRDSKLLEEELLGERMHQQLLARGTPLLTTMSKYVAAPLVVGGGWWWLVVGGGVVPYS